MRKIAANYVCPIVSEPLLNGTLILDDDGKVIDLVEGAAGFKEHENVEFYNGLIVPGFVNAHCHLELSYLRGKIPQKTRLPGFLKHFVNMRSNDPETIIAPAQEAHSKMRSSGIVAIGDITNTPHTLSIKENHGIFYHSFVEIWGNDPVQAAGILSKGLELLEHCKSGLKQTASLALHSTYTVSETLFSEVLSYCKGRKNTISIHNQETASENELFTSNSGELKEILEYLGDDLSGFKTGNDSALVATIKKLPPEQKILLIHNTFSTEDDIQKAEEIHHSLYWVLCPRANLYIEDRIPDIPVFMGQNIDLALGTDSLASNDKLSILEEMKTISNHYPAIGLNKLLRWGTLNGAKALGLEYLIGSFEKGKKPGVNLIENIDFDRMALRENSSVKVLV